MVCSYFICHSLEEEEKILLQRGYFEATHCIFIIMVELIEKHSIELAHYCLMLVQDCLTVKMVCFSGTSDNNHHKVAY